MDVGGLSGCDRVAVWWGSGAWGVFGFVEGLEGQGLEFGDELVESAGVVEPGLVALLLIAGDVSGDGLAGDGSGPAQVGAVEFWRVALAAASLLPAFGVAQDQAAG